MGKEIVLPSGAKMIANAAPFAESKRLWQACLKDFRHLDVTSLTEINVELLKNAFCIISSSERIDRAIQPCLRRCLYAGSKIDDGTFEKEEARQDYLPVIEEVLKINLLPFLRGQLLKWGIDVGLLTSLFPMLK